MVHAQTQPIFHEGNATSEGRQIKKISVGDVKAALQAGYDDFSQRPSHAVFLGLLYPLLCFILLAAVTGRDLLPLIYPLIAGFSLVGPFAALGLYEMSRKREETGEMHWRDAFGVFRAAAFSQILVLGMLLLLLFSLWILTALLLYTYTLGTIATPEAPLAGLFTTPEGWTMIMAGNALGAVFSVLVFAISAVSFPMLLDRHVDAPTAVALSLKVVAANPRAMAYWGFVITAGLFLGFLPLAVGLAVIFPILGHATWHIYRATVK